MFAPTEENSVCSFYDSFRKIQSGKLVCRELHLSDIQSSLPPELRCSDNAYVPHRELSRPTIAFDSVGTVVTRHESRGSKGLIALILVATLGWTGSARSL